MLEMPSENRQCQCRRNMGGQLIPDPRYENVTVTGTVPSRFKFIMKTINRVLTHLLLTSPKVRQ